MQAAVYPYSRTYSPDVFEFDFESTGPKGKVHKRVQYSLLPNERETYLNLAFGDWYDSIQYLDDTVVTNNQDAKKVMLTVVQTMLEVLFVYRDLSIYVKGSSPARTRLYQQGIAANLSEDIPIEVYGLRDGTWELFSRDTNYSAFMAKLKKQFT